MLEEALASSSRILTCGRGKEVPGGNVSQFSYGAKETTCLPCEKGRLRCRTQRPVRVAVAPNVRITDEPLHAALHILSRTEDMAKGSMALRAQSLSLR